MCVGFWQEFHADINVVKPILETSAEKDVTQEYLHASFQTSFICELFSRLKNQARQAEVILPFFRLAEEKEAITVHVGHEFLVTIL